jgi:hypothetical protein
VRYGLGSSFPQVGFLRARKYFSSRRRDRSRTFADILDLCEETVAPPGYRFHKARTLSGIAQGLPNFIDGFVQAVIEVNKCVGGPQVLLQFFPSNHFPGMLEQHSKHLKWLFLQPDLHPVLAQFTRPKIHFENTKTETPVGMFFLFH